MNVLEVENLCISIRTPHGLLPAITDVSFTLEAGSTLGVVGESGSGKTLTALAVMGLIPPRLASVTGSVRLNGVELNGRPTRELARIRGRQIAMVFQDARRNLDPTYTIGEQIAEVARHHLQISRGEAQQKTREALELVGIPARRGDEYPHTFSGGMCQRAMLALAVITRPRVLICDEPTTALDATVQAHVLDVLRDLREKLGLAILFISHDLAVIAEMCQRVAVMYEGQIAEVAPVETLFAACRHPYTEGLLRSIPKPQQRKRELVGIPGNIAALGGWATGCRFSPRCAYVAPICRSDPPALAGEGHLARCFFSGQLDLAGFGDAA